MIAPPTSYHAARFPRFSPTGMLVAWGAHAAILAAVLVANRDSEAPAITASLAVRIIAPSVEAPPAPAQSKTPVAKQHTPSETRLVKQPEKMAPAPVSETGTISAAPPQPQAPAAHAATSARADTQSSGSYTEPRFDAAYLHNPAPEYPALSRRMGEEGKVQLRVFVETSGRPSQVQLKTSSGSARLDKAAQDAVRRWKFTPARRGETQVAAWVIVPIVFNLKD